MGYAERFLLGIVIVLSAYSFFNNVQSRHQIHTIAATLKDCLCSCLGCYCMVQTIRLALVAIVFTGGFNLIINSSILMGLFAQFLVLSIQAFQFRNGCFCLPKIQSLIINVCIFIFLLKDHCQKCQNDKANTLLQAESDLKRQQSQQSSNNKLVEQKRESVQQKKSGKGHKKPKS